MQRPSRHPTCSLRRLHRVIDMELKAHGPRPTTILGTRPLRPQQRLGHHAVRADASGCGCLAYRYLTAVDVEGFSCLNALDQLQLLNDLGQVLDIAATRVSLDRALWQVQERGDGELAVLPPDTDGPRLIADYPRELADALSEVNSERRSRLRIRMAIHHGTLVQSRFGPVGQGPIVVSRLLDSDELRKYLAQRAELDVVLIVSASLYSDVIETRLHHLDPAQFARADVLVKGRSYPAYIHTTNHPVSTARELGNYSRRGDPPHCPQHESVILAAVIDDSTYFMEELTLFVRFLVVSIRHNRHRRLCITYPPCSMVLHTICIQEYHRGIRWWRR
jgi:class 3 adenylate cyclase